VAKKAARKRTRKQTTKKKTRTSSRTGAATTTAKKKTGARSAATRRRQARRPPPAPSRMSTAATAVRGVVAGAVATVSRQLPGAAKPDALEILEREHRRFEELMKQGEDTTERARATRRQLLEILTAELNAHELMEEKVLYPALQAHPQARDIVLEGFEEHHVADLIVKELQDVATNDQAWGAKFKVLKENIEHHIEEEEGSMFRLARGIFSAEELRRLGARMLKTREA
jgi:hemerythrin-like domain-containing protein